MDFLVANGATVDDTTNDEWTALMWAAWNGHTAVCELLLALGADVNLRNNMQETARDIAESEGHGDCLDVLSRAVMQRAEKNIKDQSKEKEAIIDVLQKHGILRKHALVEDLLSLLGKK